MLPPRPRGAPAWRIGVPPAGAFVGAAVAVAGVVLGIGALLWAGDPPAAEPAARGSSAIHEGAGNDEPAVPEPGRLPDPYALPDAAVTEGPLPASPEAPAPAPSTPGPAAATPAPATPAAAGPTAAPAGAPGGRAAPVLVLNNSRIEGLAARVARQFEAAGWPVRGTGSLRGRIRATTVYYPAGQEAVARAFAQRFPGVERVLPRLRNLPGEGLTVVVTRDFAD